MELLVILAVLAVVVGLVGMANRRNQARELERRRTELEPVEKLAYEDITALGTELQALDAEVAGVTLDEGARADYQRALDAYEDAKVSATRWPSRRTSGTSPRSSTTAATRSPACGQGWRGAAAGPAAPVLLRPAPRAVGRRRGLHARGRGDPDGAACALDAERVTAGADPAIRQVMVGSRRVPYWQGGPAYAPYAAGYFAAGAGMSLRQQLG